MKSRNKLFFFKKKKKHEFFIDEAIKYKKSKYAIVFFYIYI
jgi:hypothetical protein